MIIEEIYYAVQCDNCKKKCGNDDGDYEFWNEESYSEDCAIEAGWHKEGYEHYCPDCHSFNDEDELVIGKK
jgi:hypothetical protein